MPSTIYKYVSVDPGLKILENWMIRLTQPSEFNDPYELSPSFDASGLFGNIPPTSGTLPFPTEEMCKKIHSGLLDGMLRKVSETIGIFCATTSPNNALMWSHYAESHKGLVFEFDHKHPFFNRRRNDNDLFGYLHKVQYSNQRIHIDVTNSNDWLAEFPKIFYHKGCIWEYEEEYRLIWLLDQADKVINNSGQASIYLFNIDPSAIKTIIFGAKSSKDTINKIKELIRKTPRANHIVLKKATLNDKDNDLSIIPIPA